MTQKSAPEPRRKDAAATRQAILKSARRAFVEFGYDGAGVRDIAKGAGVTAMLVNRYFGSKEQLFAEVIAGVMTEPTILTDALAGSSTKGADIAAALVGITGREDTPLDGFLIMLRSASNRRAAEIGREQIEAGYQRMMAGALGGPLAAERAGLVLALITGVQVMRQMVGLSALADADPAVLRGLLEPVFAGLAESSAAVGFTNRGAGKT